jgi:hypothetical protein
MGRLAPMPVETDMSSFEGAFNEDWCHRAGRPCGNPPSPRRRLHVAHVVNGHCVACDRPACPECQLIDLQAGR